MTLSGKLTTNNSQPDSGHKSLPESYGSTEAALLPRDPGWMFVYWDITDASKARIAGEHGGDVFKKAGSVIRVYETASGRYFDISVKLDARNWYINVPEGGKSYYCEIGLVLPDGRFIAIVKTNSVNLPAGRVSDVTDEKWMSVSSDFEKLLQISGVEYVGLTVGISTNFTPGDLDGLGFTIVTCTNDLTAASFRSKAWAEGWIGTVLYGPGYIIVTNLTEAPSAGAVFLFR